MVCKDYIVALALYGFAGVSSSTYSVSSPNTKAKGFLALKRDTVASLSLEVSDALADTLGKGIQADVEHLIDVLKVMGPMFKALPKNKQGRLSTPVMRHAVHRYFTEKYGWIVKGFEPQSIETAPDISDTPILQQKIPGFITSILERKLVKNGFGLKDIVVVAAVVEILITNEESKALDLAYRLQGHENKEWLDDNELLEVLYGYFTVELMTSVTSNETQHRDALKDISSYYPHWETTRTFISDLVWNKGYEEKSESNPFLPTLHDYSDSTFIAQQITKQFGPWSNHECMDMKELLVPMDEYNRGRVKLADFYKASKDGSWQFHESSEYLRQLGALDETSPHLGPQVVIPNYVQGMSNCITSTAYYSVCCLNECDNILRDLEEKVGAAEVPKEKVVESLQSYRMGENFSKPLLARLDQVAEVNHGLVPIHGRLFAQWLHFAFPRDCPYPHKIGSINPLTFVEFEEVGGAKEVSDAEILQYTEGEFANKSAYNAVVTHWDAEEELLPAATESDNEGYQAEILIALRVVAGIILIAGILGSIMSSMEQLHSMISPEKKDVEHNI